jgi:hypothetical protein
MIVDNVEMLEKDALQGYHIMSNTTSSHSCLGYLNALDAVPLLTETTVCQDTARLADPWRRAHVLVFYPHQVLRYRPEGMFMDLSNECMAIVARYERRRETDNAY